MKRIFLLSLIALLCGCFSSKKKIANIEFRNIAIFDEYEYLISFVSDVDLDKLYKKQDGESVVFRQLVCALEDDTNFSIEHNLRKFFRGDVALRSNQSDPEGRKIDYVSVGDFFVTKDQGVSEMAIDDQELKQLAKIRTTFPCKIVMTIYLRRPYYSSTMLIPTAAIASLQRRRTTHL